MSPLAQPIPLLIYLLVMDFVSMSVQFWGTELYNLQIILLNLALLFALLATIPLATTQLFHVFTPVLMEHSPNRSLIDTALKHAHLEPGDRQLSILVLIHLYFAQPSMALCTMQIILQQCV